MKQTGSVDLCVNQRSRKAKLLQQDIDTVNNLVKINLTLQSRKSKKNAIWMYVRKPVRKAVIKLAYRIKKSIHTSEPAHSRYDVQENGIYLFRAQSKWSGFSGWKRLKYSYNQAKLHYIYFMPYSPNSNPIEKLWSKVKALLCKFKARSLNEPPESV